MKMSWLNNEKSLFLLLFPIVVFVLFFCFFNSIFVRASSNFIKIVPSSSSSYSEDSAFEWKNPENTLEQNLSEIADFKDFNKENSAYIFSDSISNTTPSLDGIKSFLEISSFGISEEMKKKKILNTNLRFSFAGKVLNSDEKISVEYFINDEWSRAGEFCLDKDVSNILNGGYFLYGLPVFENWDDLSNFKVRFVVEKPEKAQVFLDSVWLEIEFIEAVPLLEGVKSAFIFRVEKEDTEINIYKADDEYKKSLKLSSLSAEKIDISWKAEFKYPWRGEESSYRYLSEKDLDWEWYKLGDSLIGESSIEFCPVGVEYFLKEEGLKAKVNFTNKTRYPLEELKYKFTINYPSDLFLNDNDFVLQKEGKNIRISSSSNTFKKSFVKIFDGVYQSAAEFSVYVGEIKPGESSQVVVNLFYSDAY